MGHIVLICADAGIVCRRGREARRTEERKGAAQGVGLEKVPRVAIDYFFMSKADEKASVNPLMVMPYTD